MCDRGGRTVISSTYGGEALSLAAAKAVIDIYRRENVVAALWERGEALWSAVNDLFETHGIPLRLQGFWPCPQFVGTPGAPGDIVGRFFRAAYRHGVILYNISYVNFSHTEADVSCTLERLERAMADL